MKRKIIIIDEEKCNGCGLCIPNCPEGALQIIDGKARLVSDLFCDGLGACIGYCPEGAIEVEEREAEVYDEEIVMENITKQGEGVIRAHLKHLKEHNDNENFKKAMNFLKQRNIEITLEDEPKLFQHHSGCPGSRAVSFERSEMGEKSEEGKRVSELQQWPIQLHLISPLGLHFQGRDVLLAADCVAYTAADFHKDFLKGKSLAIACPKLDSGREVYLEKVRALVDLAKINTLTVITMEVPCCMGLLQLAKEALLSAERSIPLKHIVVSIRGEVLQEEWVSTQIEA